MSGASERTSLRELAGLFFRLGATAFGGPAAHIAMIEDEVVRRRGWVSSAEFLDLLGATNLIPGPNSTELAIHLGFARRRWAGLLVAGVCFIVPAMLLTGLCGWAYQRYQTVPQLGWVLYGLKPVILAVVVQAIVGLTPKAAKSPALWVIGALGLVASLLGVDELLILGVAGALAAVSARGRTGALGALVPLVPVGGAAAASAVTLSSLFLVFLKIGSVLFGSGYVLLAFLRSELVERLHWLTEAQLIDAIAVGQVTPGPVFTSATFIGYVLAGPWGALVATAGIFAPAFFFVAVSGPLVPKLRASPTAGAVLDGVNVASLALMAAVTVQLGRAALVDLPTVLLGAVSALLLVRFKLNSTWLVLGGAGAGAALHLAGWA